VGVWVLEQRPLLCHLWDTRPVPLSKSIERTNLTGLSLINPHDVWLKELKILVTSREHVYTLAYLHVLRLVLNSNSLSLRHKTDRRMIEWDSPSFVRFCSMDSNVVTRSVVAMRRSPICFFLVSSTVEFFRIRPRFSIPSTLRTSDHRITRSITSKTMARAAPNVATRFEIRDISAIPTGARASIRPFETCSAFPHAIQERSLVYSEIYIYIYTHTCTVYITERPISHRSHRTSIDHPERVIGRRLSRILRSIREPREPPVPSRIHKTLRNRQRSQGPSSSSRILFSSRAARQQNATKIGATSIKERADLVPRPSLISLEGPRPYRMCLCLCVSSWLLGEWPARRVETHRADRTLKSIQYRNSFSSPASSTRSFLLRVLRFTPPGVYVCRDSFVALLLLTIPREAFPSRSDESTRNGGRWSTTTMETETIETFGFRVGRELYERDWSLSCTFQSSLSSRWATLSWNQTNDSSSARN